MNINGKVFFITGGASGLGAGCVKHFVKNGAKVLIADLNEKLGSALEAECSGKAKFVKVDVTSESSVTEGIETAMKTLGGIDGLINCAGIAVAEKVINKEGELHSLSKFLKVLEHHPRYITKRPGGKGFAEFAQLFIGTK
jgi:NAD(P)-dependent dehydrogenase (short-subunit alcohol dehydrogenase family)